MPSSDPEERLKDISRNVTLIETFTAGLTYEAFAADERTFYACLHALLIISEAASKLGNEAETLVPGQPWRDIRGFGNVIRHEYEVIEPAAVWRIIKLGELESLLTAVRTALDRF